MREPFRIAAVCAAMLTMTVPAVAGQKAPDRDAAELSAYRLSSATLNKVTAAIHAFVQAMQNDPKFKSVIAAQRELDALEDKDPRTPAEDRRMEVLQKQVDDAEKQMEALGGSDDKAAETIADMAQTLGKIPHISEALGSAGLTMHEFALFEMSMLQAGFAAGLKKAGLLKQMPPGVPPENVQFVIDHEAEIQRIQTEMSSIGGKSPGR